MTYLKGDCLITAGASKPAPFFAELVHRLAHLDPYGDNTDPEYRRAIDACLAAFGERLVDVETKELPNGRHRVAA